MLLLSWVHVQASTRCSVLIVAQLCRNHASRLVQADTPGAVLLAGDLTYATTTITTTASATSHAGTSGAASHSRSSPRSP